MNENTNLELNETEVNEETEGRERTGLKRALLIGAGMALMAGATKLVSVGKKAYCNHKAKKAAAGEIVDEVYDDEVYCEEEATEE